MLGKKQLKIHKHCLTAWHLQASNGVTCLEYLVDTALLGKGLPLKPIHRSGDKWCLFVGGNDVHHVVHQQIL